MDFTSWWFLCKILRNGESLLNISAKVVWKSKAIFMKCMVNDIKTKFNINKAEENRQRLRHSFRFHFGCQTEYEMSTLCHVWPTEVSRLNLK